MRIGSDERRRPSKRGASMIDREPLPRSDNSGAQASECRCEPPRGAARAAGGLLYPANRLMIFVQEPANGEFRSKRITIMNTVQSSRVAGDITIIVPVYDTLVEHLDECMRSIFAQTVVPHEILVADDGSTLEETRDLSARVASPLRSQGRTQ